METLNKKEIKNYLGQDFLFCRKISSTFDEKNAEIVVAAMQTSGQGRLGREFFSPSGGIYFCIKTKILPLLALNAAAGVMRAMQKRGFDPQAKWVNDIMLGGKKVCGILAKADGKSATIGVGINYCIKDFPQMIRDKAGSLYQTTDGINEFAAFVINEVQSAICENNLEFYKSRLYGKGKEFVLPDGSKAVIVDVDSSGRLLYNKDGKTDSLSCGDIII